MTPTAHGFRQGWAFRKPRPCSCAKAFAQRQRGLRKWIPVIHPKKTLITELPHVNGRNFIQIGRSNWTIHGPKIFRLFADKLSQNVAISMRSKESKLLDGSIQNTTLTTLDPATTIRSHQSPRSHVSFSRFGQNDDTWRIGSLDLATTGVSWSFKSKLSSLDTVVSTGY